MATPREYARGSLAHVSVQPSPTKKTAWVRLGHHLCHLAVNGGSNREKSGLDDGADREGAVVIPCIRIEIRGPIAKK
jgi:hypothetical protein